MSYIAQNLPEINDNKMCAKIYNTLLTVYPESFFSFCNNIKNPIFKDIMNNIDTTIMDNCKRTFIFYLGNINNLIAVMESNMVFDINHRDTLGFTFIVLYTNTDKFMSVTQFKHFINLLQKRNYNFNVDDRNLRFFLNFLLRIISITSYYEKH